MDIGAIDQYLPHRSPMILVEGLEALFEQGACCSLTVTPSLALSSSEGLSEGGLLEHMAQSAALFSGVEYKAKGEKIPVGFITKVSHVHITSLPQHGDHISTRIEVIHDLGYASLVQAESFVAGVSLATCRLQVFVQKD